MWSQGRSAQALRTLAGSKQEQHGQEDKKDKCKGRVRNFWDKVILPFSFVPSCALSSFPWPLLLFHFLLDLPLQLQSSTSTKALSFHRPIRPSFLSSFSFIHPLSLPFLVSDRQSYPPRRFLSVGLPQQRCSVMWNLIFSPPKPNPWPRQSSQSQRGRGAEAGKGRLLGKGQIPQDTFVYARVCAPLHAWECACTRSITWVFCCSISMCVWFCIQACMKGKYSFMLHVLTLKLFDGFPLEVKTCFFIWEH